MDFNFLVIAFQISIDDFSASWEGNGSYMIFTLVKVPCLFGIETIDYKVHYFL